MLKKILSSFVILCFSLTILGPLPKAQADTPLNLPAPGTMINLSPAFEPALIKGLTVHKDNPFLFDFILDTGHSGLSSEAIKQEGDRLVKYFFACLTIPEKDLWVNLSPYEKDRIIPQALGQTGLGRDLLAQDYILKQLTASLIYPEKDLGKEFWNRVYAKSQAMYGSTQIPVNTFNKVWILANKATVYEHNQTAFVIEGHLKVMLDEDYLAMQKHQNPGSVHSISSQIIRSIVLPEIEKEVNTGKNFAMLRQIFYSQILAVWYKKNLKKAILNQLYADKSTVKGVNLNDPSIKEKIYQQYIKAYKKGVFNYIKEEAQADGQTIPRKYFSGGYSSKLEEDEGIITSQTPQVTQAFEKLSGDQLEDLSTNANLGDSPDVMMGADNAMSTDDDKFFRNMKLILGGFGISAFLTLGGYIGHSATNSAIVEETLRLREAEVRFDHYPTSFEFSLQGNDNYQTVSDGTGVSADTLKYYNPTGYNLPSSIFDILHQDMIPMVVPGVSTRVINFHSHRETREILGKYLFGDFQHSLRIRATPSETSDDKYLKLYDGGEYNDYVDSITVVGTPDEFIAIDKRLAAYKKNKDGAYDFPKGSDGAMDSTEQPEELKWTAVENQTILKGPVNMKDGFTLYDLSLENVPPELENIRGYKITNALLLQREKVFLLVLKGGEHYFIFKSQDGAQDHQEDIDLNSLLGSESTVAHFSGSVKNVDINTANSLINYEVNQDLDLLAHVIEPVQPRVTQTYQYYGPSLGQIGGVATVLAVIVGAYVGYYFVAKRDARVETYIRETQQLIKRNNHRTSFVYEMEEGDTLEIVAGRTGADVQTLSRFNHLDPVIMNNLTSDHPVLVPDEDQIEIPFKNNGETRERLAGILLGDSSKSMRIEQKGSRNVLSLFTNSSNFNIDACVIVGDAITLAHVRAVLKTIPTAPSSEGGITQYYDFTKAGAKNSDGAMEATAENGPWTVVVATNKYKVSVEVSLSDPATSANIYKDTINIYGVGQNPEHLAEAMVNRISSQVDVSSKKPIAQQVKKAVEAFDAVRAGKSIFFVSPQFGVKATDVTTKAGDEIVRVLGVQWLTLNNFSEFEISLGSRVITQDDVIVRGDGKIEFINPSDAKLWAEPMNNISVRFYGILASLARTDLAMEANRSLTNVIYSDGNVNSFTLQLNTPQAVHAVRFILHFGNPPDAISNGDLMSNFTVDGNKDYRGYVRLHFKKGELTNVDSIVASPQTPVYFPGIEEAIQTALMDLKGTSFLEPLPTQARTVTIENSFASVEVPVDTKRMATLVNLEPGVRFVERPLVVNEATRLSLVSILAQVSQEALEFNRAYQIETQDHDGQVINRAIIFTNATDTAYNSAILPVYTVGLQGDNKILRQYMAYAYRTMGRTITPSPENFTMLLGTRSEYKEDGNFTLGRDESMTINAGRIGKVAVFQSFELRNSRIKKSQIKGSQISNFIITPHGSMNGSTKIKVNSTSPQASKWMGMRMEALRAVYNKKENGGIDLNTSNAMESVIKDGQGVEMNVDQAMIARFEKNGVTSLSPFIFKVTPIVSIWPLAGLQAPAGPERLAKI